MLLAQGRMWWVGESAKVKDDRQHGVHCYSSEDLLSWRDEGPVLRNSDVRGLHGEPAPSGGWVVERPKLLFNARTGLFVLWFHLERSRDYRLNAAAVATCASPCGQYRFVHALRPGGLRSLDASVFQEGRLAYRVMDVAHKTVVIMRMSADYLNTTGPPLAAPAVGREAPVLFKWRGRYYLGTSGITWWAPNPSLVHEAPSLRGPWRALGSPFEGRAAHDGQSHADNSFRSQPNFVLTYPTLEVCAALPIRRLLCRSATRCTLTPRNPRPVQPGCLRPLACPAPPPLTSHGLPSVPHSSPAPRAAGPRRGRVDGGPVVPRRPPLPQAVVPLPARGHLRLAAAGLVQPQRAPHAQLAARVASAAASAHNGRGPCFARAAPRAHAAHPTDAAAAAAVSTPRQALRGLVRQE